MESAGRTSCGPAFPRFPVQEASSLHARLRLRSPKTFSLMLKGDRRGKVSPIILQMSGDLAKLEGEGAGDDPAQCYLCPPTGSEGKPTPFHSSLAFEEARIHRIYPYPLSSLSSSLLTHHNTHTRARARSPLSETFTKKHPTIPDRLKESPWKETDGVSTVCCTACCACVLPLCAVANAS